MSAADNLMRARCRLIAQDPWFGTMAANFEWKENADIGTMGVCMKSNGRVECHWNAKFVRSLTMKQLIGVIKHEIGHLVRLHILRSYQREPDTWNVATDAVINGPKSQPHIKDLPGDCIHMPTDNQEIGVESTSEEIYDWIVQKRPKDGKGSPQDLMGGGEVIDDHDMWGKESIDEGIARQIVHDMCRQATQTAGDTPGYLEDAIKRLGDPYIAWRAMLRMYIGRKAGGKRRTWSRRNRRRDEFGVKGKSTHASVPLVVHVDTSGSITHEILHQFFAEIESMAHKFKIRVAQWDVGFKKIEGYRRGDWRTIKIQGRGGTDLIPHLEHCEENGLFGRVNIILTDGYLNWPDENYARHNVIWCICSSQQPPWGDVVQLPEMS